MLSDDEYVNLLTNMAEAEAAKNDLALPAVMTIITEWYGRAWRMDKILRRRRKKP